MSQILFKDNKPTEAERNKIIDNLISEYPFLKHKIIGESHCKRNIDCLILGNNDNNVLITAGYHGMEWLTTLLIFNFIEKISKCIKTGQPIAGGINIAEYLELRGITFVPCVNPDGIEISINGCESAREYSKIVKNISKNNTKLWQSNARGVDINHNFDADWDKLHNLEIKSNITGPSSTRYGGEYAESELETQAITSLCRKNYFRQAFAFHSQGEEIYWQYGDDLTEKSELIARVLSMISGYKMSKPEGLAVGGGFKDWFIKEFTRPAFTIEIGKGKNPLPLEDIVPIYNKLENMLVLSCII